jgi:hypothetical protein
MGRPDPSAPLIGDLVVRFYDYTDAVTLLADFWTDVDSILQEREGKR